MTIKKVSDLTPDASNANKGTERGRHALEASLRKYGAGRSILIDKDGRIIAGNKSAEIALDVGIEDVIIVQTDGSKLVAVQRTDLDLNDTAARELAYADNRTGQLDLDFDVEQVLSDLQQGVDLTPFWFPHELDAMVNGVLESGDFDPAQEWVGMPEFEQEDIGAMKSIKVHFATKDALESFAKLTKQTITMDTKSIWYPPKENLDLVNYKAVDES